MKQEMERTDAKKRELSLAEAKTHFRSAMREAGPGRLIARHPFSSVALATLAGLVLSRSGAVSKSFDIAAGTTRAVGNLGLAIDAVDSIAKIVGKKI